MEINIDKYAKSFAEVWAALDRSAARMEEHSALTDKKIAEYVARMKEQSALTDQQIAETNRKVAETTANIDKYIAELNETRKEVGGLGKSYGMHAESYFFESLKKSRIFGGITYDIVGNDFKSTLRMPDGERIDAQFDIVMSNGDSVAIIEVKSKVKQDDVKKLVNKKLGDFKKLFLQYSGYKFYLGVAGFSYDTNAEQEAIKNGVGILKLSGENVEIEDEHLLAYT